MQGLLLDAAQRNPDESSSNCIPGLTSFAIEKLFTRFAHFIRTIVLLINQQKSGAFQPRFLT
jgi:hypothetical protein